MSSDLTVINNAPTELAKTGGLGLDFGSKLFQLKPATVSIVQPSTTAEGAIKGKLRIPETGDQFDSMFVTLLVMPQEQRSYYAGGEPGQLNRTPDNLMCFSRDMVRPDKNAKVPGALKCDGCPKASWDKWRQTKDRKDIPPCDAYYYALLIDTEFKMPLQMYLRSSAKAPFEQGMQNLSRKFAMMKAKGLNPNIYDIGFKLSTKKVQKGATVSWIPELSDFRVLTEAEREEFGEVYQQFIARKNNAANASAETEASDQIDETTQNIDNLVNEPVSGEYVGEPGSDGTITI